MFEQKLKFAAMALSAGNLAASEIVCQDVLELSPQNPAALNLVGVVAARIGAFDRAMGYLKAARAADPNNSEIRKNLALLRDARRPPAKPGAGARYLLIKSWGFGFWSDVSAVLGALLLAEITDRIPVVHWGTNSLFNDGSGSNAFELYFEPISAVGLSDLAGLADASFFPPKWSRANLNDENIAKWRGHGSRCAPLYLLNRPETIAVSDFYTGVINVAPWIPAGHPMQDKPIDAVYRYLIYKYLRPKASIRSLWEPFFAARLQGMPFVAVHMRGSDKACEDQSLQETNDAYFRELASIDPSWRIFLLTDDAQLLARVTDMYGDRVVSTDCQRTDTATGVHLRPDVDRVRAGTEVMTDTYLALRADRFVGNGRSCVSAMIALMKDWPPGSCTLIGKSQFLERNLSLYVS